MQGNSSYKLSHAMRVKFTTLNQILPCMQVKWMVSNAVVVFGWEQKYCCPKIPIMIMIFDLFDSTD